MSGKQSPKRVAASVPKQFAPTQDPMFYPGSIADMPMQAVAPGGGNSILNAWIARDYQGPYETRYPTASDERLQVPDGQLTFDAEGKENPGGAFHSREAHAPGGGSGVTIGRGYDVGSRRESGVLEDLMGAGLSAEDAQAYADARGKKGKTASRYVKNNDLPDITLEQQKALFATSYAQEKSEVARISGKADTEKAYGAYDVDKGNPALRDLMVDLKFRGDYTPGSRRSVQELAANDDIEGLAANLGDRKKWASVPDDRFERRKAYAQEAADERQIERDLPLTFAAPIENAGNPDFDRFGRRKSDTPG